MPCFNADVALKVNKVSPYRSVNLGENWVSQKVKRKHKKDKTEQD